MTGLDLRPLTLGEILDRAFLLYRRHFLLFIGITAIPQMFGLAFGLIQIFAFGPTTAISGGGANSLFGLHPYPHSARAGWCSDCGFCLRAGTGWNDQCGHRDLPRQNHFDRSFFSPRLERSGISSRNNYSERFGDGSGDASVNHSGNLCRLPPACMPPRRSCRGSRSERCTLAQLEAYGEICRPLLFAAAGLLCDRIRACTPRRRSPR